MGLGLRYSPLRWDEYRSPKDGTLIRELVLGEDGHGADFKLYGDTSGAYMLWDASANSLSFAGVAEIDIVVGSVDISSVEGIVMSGAMTADAILISGTCADNAFEVTGAVSGNILEVTTGGFVKGIHLNADGTTGIEIGSNFTGVDGIVLGGTHSDCGIEIDGTCADGIRIDGNCSDNGIEILGSCTDSAFQTGTGTFGTGILLGGTITTGISVGTCTTGLTMTGTCTNGIDLTSMTLTSAKDNAFISVGSVQNRKEIGVTADLYALQVAIDSTVNPTSGNSAVYAAYLSMDATTIDQTNSRVGGLMAHAHIYKNVAAAYGIQGHATAKANISTVGGAHLIGVSGKFTVDTSMTVAVGNCYGVLAVVGGAGSVTDNCYALNAHVESGVTAADGLAWLSTYSNVTYGMLISTTATITHGIAFSGNVSHAVRFAAAGATTGCVVNTTNFPDDAGPTSHHILIDIGGTDHYIPVWDNNTWS